MSGKLFFTLVNGVLLTASGAAQLAHSHWVFGGAFLLGGIIFFVSAFRVWRRQLEMKAASKE